ncbi:MAG: methyltransferase domain-containing protein [Elusimicrobiota bacterium]
MEENPDFDPAAHTLESLQAWNETAASYEALSNRLFTRTAEQFVEFAGLKKGWRVLDVACGPGVASRAAAARIGERGSLMAVDLAPLMIDRARQAPAPARAAPIEWAVMDAHALKVPDASFDAVVSQLGLMLFAQPDVAMAEMRRAAKPGAIVACLVQGRREKMLFTSLVLHAILERDPSLKAAPGAPTLYAFGPDGAMEQTFARADLLEISTKRLTGTFRFSSPEDYWTTMTEGSGRTGALLRRLSAANQAWVKKTVLRRAAKNQSGGAIEVPYEFMMARGYKNG